MTARGITAQHEARHGKAEHDTDSHEDKSQRIPLSPPVTSLAVKMAAKRVAIIMAARQSVCAPDPQRPAV